MLNYAGMRGFFTPMKAHSGGRAVVQDTPMTGRRDLGAGGPLHLWNIQNTPGTPSHDATDSEMHGVRSAAVDALLRLQAACLYRQMFSICLCVHVALVFHK